MNGSYELTTMANGRVVFRLRTAAGTVLLTSEPYAARPVALEAIHDVRANAGIDTRYDRRIATNGHPFFLLRTASGRVLATSERYLSAHAREDAIAAVKAAAPQAPIGEPA